jgi:uncharacterized protein
VVEWTTSIPIRPVPDAITRFFWDGVDEGRLMILRCSSCRRFVHPPRSVCRFCLSEKLAPEPVSGQAFLFSWTVATRAFHEFWNDKLPYVLARVELVEQPGLRLMTNVVDCSLERLRIGLPLQVVFAPVGDPPVVLPLFRPR